MATLVYGFDPICGWCFGFRTAVASLARIERSLAS